MIELVQTSFDDVFQDALGALDFSQYQNASGTSSRNKVYGHEYCKYIIHITRQLFEYHSRVKDLSNFCNTLRTKQGKNFSNFKNLEH